MPWEDTLLTVYVSPAQKTPPDCPAGPSITSLDVVAPVLLPLLFEAVSQSVPRRSLSDEKDKEE